MTIEPQLLRSIIESALMAYGQPLTVEKLQTLFVDDHTAKEPKNDAAANDDEDEDKKRIKPEDVPSKEAINDALEAIQQSCEDRGFELKKVSSGWRFQVRADMAQWVNKLWEEKPQRYSRALLETLSIIAYRQPITRGDIEEIRGVAVSSHIIKTLSEREWVKVVGHRDVPGRPSLFATTKQFLDYFNLESLEELPSLRELADVESLSPELDLQATAASAESNTAQEGEDSTDEENPPCLIDIPSESNQDADLSEMAVDEPDASENVELISVEDTDVEDAVVEDTIVEETDIQEEFERESRSE